MHPILSDLRKLPWYMVAWLLTGILIATLLVMADQAPWSNALIFAIPVAVVYGFVASSACYVCRSLPIARRSLFLTVGVFGAASFLSGLTWLGLCRGWNAQLDPKKFVRVHRSYLINLEKLRSIERSSKDSQVAVMRDGTKILSRAGHERIKAIM